MNMEQKEQLLSFLDSISATDLLYVKTEVEQRLKALELNESDISNALKVTDVKNEHELLKIAILLSKIHSSLVNDIIKTYNKQYIKTWQGTTYNIFKTFLERNYPTVAQLL